jgi:predicted nucleic acid-binding protein
VVGAYFADTFFWVAVAHPRDAFHAHAAAWRRCNAGARLITTQEVLTEVLNWFAGLGAPARLTAAQLIDDVRVDPAIRVLPQSTAGFQSALALYRARLDKAYSLIDCRSMVAIKSLGLPEVLTNDHHFSQEGLVVLFP